MNLQTKRALANAAFARIQREARQHGWEEPPDRRHFTPKQDQVFSLSYGAESERIIGLAQLQALVPGRFEKSIFRPFKESTLSQKLSAPGKTLPAEFENGPPALITRTR
jgi:hypothetical protein